MKKKDVELSLRLPLNTIANINALAEQGILGETPNEVVLHMLRQYLFDQTLKIPRPEKIA